MGAGKGQKKRITVAIGSKTPPSLKGVDVAQKHVAWSDWVRARNISNVFLGGYYLNWSNSKHATFTEEEKAFVLREFFIDAVKSGTISFSNSSIDPEDFLLKIASDNLLGYLRKEISLEYAPQGKIESCGRALFSEWCLDPRKKLASMTDAVYFLASAAQAAAK